MIDVAPSVLAASFGNLRSDLTSVIDAGAKIIHVDVMDGHFVPPITFGTNMVELVASFEGTYVEAHLMITNPEQHIQSFVEAGADRIILHQEVTPHLHRLLGRIKELGVSSGVAINPGTPISFIDEVLEVADLVLVMTVNPGWGGQPFLRHCLPKIEAASQRIQARGLSTIIEVDGGINRQTIQDCTKAGATLLVAGSSIFRGSDPAAQFLELQELGKSS